jgi:hypothetical protein
MGTLDSTGTAPPVDEHAAAVRRGDPLHRDVALQVEFERQTMKPVFSLDRF